MGASTLGLIKILMQDLYYQYTKNYCTELGGKAKMLLTDTNSLIYKIEAEFFYEDFYKDISSYLAPAIIQKIQFIMIIQTTQLQVKRKMKHECVFKNCFQK